MVWTPIPQSIGEWLGDISSNHWLDLLWRVFVTLAIVGLAVSLGSMGTLGIILAFVIIGALASDRVSLTISDIYNRNFWST